MHEDPITVDAVVQNVLSGSQGRPLGDKPKLPAEFIGALGSHALRMNTTPEPRAIDDPLNLMEPDDGIFTDMATGFMESGIVVGGAEFLWRAGVGNGLEAEGVNPNYDPDFDLNAWSLNSPLGKRILQTMDSRNDGDALFFKGLLEASKNQEEAEFYAIRYLKQVQQRQRQQDAGGVDWFLGVAGSIGIDIGVLVATAGAASPLVAGSRVGRAAHAAATTAKTVKGARAKAALKLGALGGLEGGGEQLMQSLTDVNVTDSDILMAAGFGAGAGALLGSIAPKMLGNVINEQTVKDTVNRMAAERAVQTEALERAGHRDVGAAARLPEGDESLEAPTFSSTPNAPISRWMPDWIRSPKRLVTQWTIDANKRAQKYGTTGSQMWAGVMNKVYSQTLMTDAERAGVARGHTIQRELEAREQMLVFHTMAQRDAYSKWAKDIMGMGTLKQLVNNEYVTSSVGQKLRPGQAPIPNYDEFRNYSDLLALARAEGDADAVQAIQNAIASRVGDDNLKETMKVLDTMGSADDKFYNEYGQVEVEMGLLDPKVLERGAYRPQNWNHEAIEGNRAEFVGLLTQIFEKNPSRAWAVKFFEPEDSTVFRAAEGGEAIPFWREDEEFADFMKRDPETATEVLDEWNRTKVEARVEKQAEIQRKINSELRQLGEASASSALSKATRRARRLLGSKLKLETELRETIQANPMDVRNIHRLNTKLNKLEVSIQTLQSRTRRLQQLVMQAEDEGGILSDAVIETLRKERLLGRDTQEAAKKLSRKLAKSRRAEAQAYARKTIKEEVEQAVDNILKRRSPGDFLEDDAIEGSRHFKRRTIDLGGVRHTPRVQKFLRKNAELNSELYVNSVGRQLAIRRAFLPALRAEGVVPDDPKQLLSFKPIKAMRELMVRKYEEDESAIATKALQKGWKEGQLQKVRKELQKARTKELELYDRAFGEITRSDYANILGDPGRLKLDRILATSQAAAAASMLGNLVLAQFTDTAITAAAGGKMGSGFRRLFRTVANRKVYQDLKNDDEAMAGFMWGMNIQQHGSIQNRYDLDSISAEIDPPGGWLRTVQRTTENVAVLQSWVNLSQTWNRWMRSSFGVGFAQQLTRDFMNWEKVVNTEVMRGFYAKHGIGADDLKAMAAMAAKFPNKRYGDIELPDTQAWAKAGRDDLVEKFQRAQLGAGHEAMLDPGIGDRPFLRREPLGRLALTFSSFMYKAGNEWFAPLVQRGVMNPTDVGVYTSMLLALGGATVANTLRNYARGELGDDDLVAMWEGDAQDGWDSMKAGILRSPLTFGMSAAALDLLGVYLGPGINEGFSAAFDTQFKPINEEYKFLRQQQGIAGLFGPAVGMVGSTAYSVGQLAEGNTESMKELLGRRTPVVNVFYIQALAQMLKQ